MSGFMCGVPVRTARTKRNCEYCGGVTDFVEYLQSSPYYPPIQTCIQCGDSYCVEEGRMQRPFQRAWRKKAVAQAVKAYGSACDCDEKRDDEGYLIPCQHQTRASGCIEITDRKANQ